MFKRLFQRVLHIARRLLSRSVWALLRLLNRMAFRLRVQGREHLPRTGGALLVANHVSYVDALCIGAASDRPVRFLMHRSYWERPLIGRVARLFGTIPVASSDDEAQKLRSLQRAARRAAAGQLVCIFAEGSISRSGALLGFRRGLEQIAREARVPIVPVALDALGVLGEGPFGVRRRLLRRFARRPVSVSFEPPLSSQASAWSVRGAVEAGLTEATARAVRDEPSFLVAVLASLRSDRRRPVLAGASASSGSWMTCAELLERALCLRAVWRREFAPGERVVCALPPGPELVLANLSLTLAGCVVQNIAAQCELDGAAQVAAGGARVVLTRRAGDDWAHFEGRVIDLEQLERRAGRGWGRFVAGLAARLPAAWLARLYAPRSLDREPAVSVLHRRGDGEYAVATSTHRALAARVSSAARVLLPTPGDVFVCTSMADGVALVLGLWLPLASGARLVGVCEPERGPRVAQARRAAFLVGSTSAVQGWLWRAREDQLATLRAVLAPVAGELPRSWAERFACPLLPALGDPWPLVLSAPDIEAGVRRQRGHQLGAGGRALPGVAVSVVDDAGQTLEDSDIDGWLAYRDPFEDGDRAQAEAWGWRVSSHRGRCDRDGFVYLSEVPEPALPAAKRRGSTARATGSDGSGPQSSSANQSAAR